MKLIHLYVAELRGDILQPEKWGFGKGIPIPVQLIEIFIEKMTGVVIQQFYLEEEL